MDDLEKWMIIWFTPNQTTILPKWIYFQKHFFKSYLPLNLFLVQHSRTSSVNLAVKIKFRTILTNAALVLLSSAIALYGLKDVLQVVFIDHILFNGDFVSV